MRCVNVACGRELKDGVKFCTYCGTKQPISSDYNLITEAKEEAFVREKAIKPDSLDIKDIDFDEDINFDIPRHREKDLNVNSNYLVWNIHAGELVRVISEVEFSKMSGVRGVIINHGTAASIYSGGECIAVLKGGKYDFVSSDKVDETLNKKLGGAAGWIKNPKRKIFSLLFGESVQDKIDKERLKRHKELSSMDDVINFLNDNMISIVLYQDRDFELIIGGISDSSGDNDFSPMEISTRHFDINVCVSGIFRINDVDSVTRYYMSGKDRLTAKGLSKKLSPLFESLLQRRVSEDTVHDVDLAEVKAEISRYLPSIENSIHSADLSGISLVRLLKVTADNEDIARFRKLSHDLYVSEDELNYLNKTNDFKNRLRDANNRQRLNEAQSESDLRRCLQEINKDNLLDKDELEKFYIVLSRERRVFEADSREKEEAALSEIQKTGMFRQEEIDILRDEVERRKKERMNKANMEDSDVSWNLKTQEYSRDFALKLLMLKDGIGYEKIRVAAENEIENIQLANDIDRASKKDEYNDSRFYKELDKKKAAQKQDNDQTIFDADLASRARKEQIESLKSVTEINLSVEEGRSKIRIAEEDARRAHEERMHAMDVDAQREQNMLHSQMTAEQLAAEQLSKLDPEAQSAYFRAGKDLEQERSLRQKQQEFYERMFDRDSQRTDAVLAALTQNNRNSMDTIAAVSGNMIENAQVQKREYRDQLQKEQSRHDMHQDKAMNYITRSNSQEQVKSVRPSSESSQQNSNTRQTPPAPAASNSSECVCPECHEVNVSADRFCQHCGHEL